MNNLIDSLLSQMTLQEKAGQLTIVGADQKDLKQMIREGKVGGTSGVLPGKDVAKYTVEMQKVAMRSRLKIPLTFMGDVIHGFHTVLPVPLAMAATWDPKLVQQADSMAAFEATSAGVTWTFAPMVDIARDPRWGRVVEGAGEDPYLGSVMAAAEVRGFQGNNLADPHTMVATAKHFVGYGAVQAGRDYNSVDMSMRTLHAIYLPPFRAALRQGLGTFMAAFVSFNGIPASENSYLLTDVLRNDWKFGGVVVSDYDAIPELQQHGVAASPQQAAMLAFNAGVDVDLHSGTYLSTLPDLVKEGKVKESRLDQAVRRVLRMKFELGLFDDPFRYNHDSTNVTGSFVPPAHREMARKVARESFVLLKNEHRLLPLKKDAGTIAVIGPLANDRVDLLGPVHALGRPEDAVTVLQGIKSAVSSGTRILYARGTGISTDSTEGFARAQAVARQADIVVMVMGESAGMSGEADSRSMPGLPGNQLDLLKAVAKTGTPVVVVLINGRPLTIPWLNDHVPAILEAWLPGTEGGPAVADVLFGDYDPSGKLPMTFPRNAGQIPIYYNHLRSGRPFNPKDKYTTRYIDIPNSPLYPFGYGLSYTTFSYSPIELATDTLGWDDTLNVSVKLTNTGPVKGTEVAQLYIRDLVASASPTNESLKGFQRVTLEPGASKEVSFTLTRQDLAFYRKDMSFGAEPGKFTVFVGGSSDTTIAQKAAFTLIRQEKQ